MTIDYPYEAPNAELPAPLSDVLGSRKNWRDYSPEYNAAFKPALLMQSVLAILSALVLDSGQTQRAFWVAFLCQWAMVWIILFRRPLKPTRLDLAIVRFGIVPLLFIVAGAGLWFLRLLGVRT